MCFLSIDYAINYLDFIAIIGVKFAWFSVRSEAGFGVAVIIAKRYLSFPKGNILEKIQAINSTEQRRKLLKGALATSSVVGLGYSGSSASASITHCIQNQRTFVATQFFIGSTPPPPSSANCAWKKVEVRKYKENGTGNPIEGFQLTSGVFRAFSPWTKILLPAVQSNLSGYPKVAWVVVYFDSVTKAEIGAFPEYTQPTMIGTAKTEAVAQASLNCVNSLQPGLGNTYKFGG